MQNLVSKLIECSRRSLKYNIVQTDYGSFLRAGGHQFQSFWTRDFCFASSGLTKLGFAEVTKNHLKFLIQNRNSKNLIPRGLDIYNPKLRVVRHTIFGAIPEKRNQRYKGRFYFEWKGEHGTVSMDSNLLTVIYSIKYYEDTLDEDFKKSTFPSFKSLMEFYDVFLKDELICQDKYSDWQDSVSRTGKTSYLNLLYLISLKLIKKHNVFDSNESEYLELKIKNLEEVFLKTFLKNDLLVAVENEEQVSLDSNLLAIDFDVFDSEILKNIYTAIKKSPLWIESLPGQCTFPEYKSSNKSLPTKFVGLLNYHDKMIWSWLVGLSLRVSAKMNDMDQVKKTLETLNKLTQRDQTIYEIYNVNLDHKPFNTWIYNSENPFSWGAGQIGESLSFSYHLRF